MNKRIVITAAICTGLVFLFLRESRHEGKRFPEYQEQPDLSQPEAKLPLRVPDEEGKAAHPSPVSTASLPAISNAALPPVQPLSPEDEEALRLQDFEAYLRYKQLLQAPEKNQDREASKAAAQKRLTNRVLEHLEQTK